MGIGVVPIGILAALFNGMWPELGILVLAIVLTFGCRLFGAFLIANQERTEMEEEVAYEYEEGL